MENEFNFVDMVLCPTEEVVSFHPFRDLITRQIIDLLFLAKVIYGNNSVIALLIELYLLLVVQYYSCAMFVSRTFLEHS